jgi:hypothetical protein
MDVSSCGRELDRRIGPCGTVAGIMARTDASRGVWKAAAGLEADARGTTSLAYKMSNKENNRLNKAAVNAIRDFPHGTVIWGARTMDGYDDAENLDYRYVPVRRLSLMIEESISKGLGFATFENNTEQLWAQIRLVVGAFMHNLFRQGAFKGEKAVDAYFVKIDDQTTTPEDILLGHVNIVVGFSPLRPSDFIEIKIRQQASIPV